MDFRTIRTFLKVSELHSFSQAASQLGYSQSAVSTQIAQLEQKLGHPLFDRIGHRIVLTEKGHTFLQYAQEILLLTEQMQQDISNHEYAGGTLRIALADSLCSSFIGNILLNYQQKYPHISVKIRTGLTGDMFNWLAHNEVDMVYTLDNRITRSELVVLSEELEPVHFYAATDHPLASSPSVSPQQLKAYPLYLTEQGISYRQNLDNLLGNLGIELPPTIELGNVQVIRSLIQHSQGIGFLPEFVVRDAPDRNALLPLAVENLEVSVWRQLVYHRGKAVTPAMEHFIQLLQHRA